MRPVTTVFTEALFIGLLLYVIVMFMSRYVYKSETVLIVSGALVHLLFEYSPFGNINEKWCKMIFN
jgi:hypothetical protein